MTLDAFATPRLTAERLTRAHWDDLRRMDQDEGFMALLGGVRDEAGTTAYLEQNLTHWAEHGFGIWMMRDRPTGDIIGRAVLRHLEIDGSDEVELGYGLLPPWWHRGLATEMALACVGIGLGPLGLGSLIALTLPENVASQRVMSRAGLRYERDVVHAGLRHVMFRTGAESGTRSHGAGSR